MLQLAVKVSSAALAVIRLHVLSLVFQRAIENLLQQIPGVVVYIDDILITGTNEEEHLAALEVVLTKLKHAGLRVQRNKCVDTKPQECHGIKVLRGASLVLWEIPTQFVIYPCTLVQAPSERYSLVLDLRRKESL